MSFIIAKKPSEGTWVTSWVEQKPFDGTWTWLAGSPRFATVFNEDDANAVARLMDGFLKPDPYKRQPNADMIAVQRIANENHQHELELARKFPKFVPKALR